MVQGGQLKGNYQINGGGIERPIDNVFNRRGEMYIVDFGYRKPPGSGEGYIPNTGVVWKVSKL